MYRQYSKHAFQSSKLNSVQQNKRHKKCRSRLWSKFKDSKIVLLRCAAASNDSFSKCFYLITLFILLILSAWSCVSSISYYFAYNVKTTIVTQKRDVLPFPTISLFNMHQVRGSSMTPELFNIIAYWMAQSESSLEDTIKKVNITCKMAKSNETTDVIYSGALTKLTQVNSLDSFKSVKTCFYGGSIINCSAAFLNTYNDYGVVFAFNVNKGIFETMRSYPDFVQYGIDSDDFMNLTFAKAGPKNGFRVELDINNNELCGSSHKYDGSGFVAMVHDPAVAVKIFSLTPSFYLAPGYTYDISIAMTHTNRKTKHLGYCMDQLGNYTGGKTNYTRDTCFSICFLQEVVRKCHCLVPPMRGFMSISKSWNLINEPYRDCRTTADLTCFSQMIEIIGNHNYCPYNCLPACQEIQYKLQIKSMKFHQSVDSKHFGTLMANFYFENMIVEYVEEMQEYYLIDVAMDIAAAICTFLGLSLMNILELALDILIYFGTLLSRTFVRKRNTIRNVPQKQNIAKQPPLVKRNSK